MYLDYMHFSFRKEKCLFLMCFWNVLGFYSRQMYIQDIAFPSSRNRDKRMQDYSNKSSLKSMHSGSGKSWSELNTALENVSGKLYNANDAYWKISTFCMYWSKTYFSGDSWKLRVWKYFWEIRDVPYCMYELCVIVNYNTKRTMV